MDGSALDFFIKLALGSGLLLVNLAIQVVAIYVLLLRFSQTGVPHKGGATAREQAVNLAVAMLYLFVAHLFQFATWAMLFLAIGEFNDFGTAFYHSTVNFTSLGYGDIVMGEEWRLLGALEAANGVLMFGLTAGLILGILTNQLTEQIEAMRAREADPD